MKQVGTRILLASLAVALPMMVGCERHSNSEQYILVATNIKLPYWQTASAGFQKAAAQYAVKVDMRGPDTFDPQGEVQGFEEALARKPAGILVSVADPNLMAPEINKAIAAGIPVITMDSDAPNSHRLYFIGTNNLLAGRLGAQRVVEKIGGKGNVVFFSMPGQPNLDERLKGYKDVFADHPGVKVVDVVDIHGESGTAMDKTSQYLGKTGNDKISAFICLEASAGKDVAEAFKRANIKDRELMAMDADESTLNLIKEGVIDATIAQKPFTMAFAGLKALDEIHHYPPKSLGTDYSNDSFSPFPKFVDTGASLVEKTNVDEYLANRQAAQAK